MTAMSWPLKALAALIASAADSPGMNLRTARRANHSRGTFRRIQLLLAIQSSTRLICGANVSAWTLA
jgi:hypothetical protein